MATYEPVTYEGLRVCIRTEERDGFEFIPDHWCAEHPAVYDFVRRFRGFWIRSERYHGWISDNRWSPDSVYYTRGKEPKKA